MLTFPIWIISPKGYLERSFADGVAFAEYTELASTCIALLADKPRRDQIAAKGCEAIEAYPQTALLQSALQSISGPP